MPRHRALNARRLTRLRRLRNHVLRGIARGTVTEDEALATGLSIDEIRRKWFVEIMNARRARA